MAADYPIFIYCDPGSSIPDDDIPESSEIRPGTLPLDPPISVAVEGQQLFRSGADLTSVLTVRAVLFDFTQPVTEYIAAGRYRLVSALSSVGLAMPAQFNVDNSPLTADGTIVVAWLPVAPGRVFAGPTSGADAQPVFRALVASDLGSGAADATKFLRGDLAWAAPPATAVSIGLTMPTDFDVTGSPAGATGAFAVAWNPVGAALVFAGPTSGPDAAPTFRLLEATDLAAGTPSSGTFLRGDLTWATIPFPFPLSIANGGTGRDMSAFGGASCVVLQETAGGILSSRQLVPGDLPQMQPAGVGHAAGIVPDPGASAIGTRPRFLADDATWRLCPGQLLAIAPNAGTDTTASPTPVLLATPDSVAINLPSSQSVSVSHVANVSNSVAGDGVRIYARIDGGTPTQIGAYTSVTAGQNGQIACVAYFAAVAPGLHTIDILYAIATGGTASVRWRTTRADCSL